MPSFATDPSSTLAHPSLAGPAPRATLDGVAITSARGVHGTGGCLAITLHERRLVLVTSYHVVRGSGGAEHDPVWIARRDGGNSSRERIGTARWGRRGIVRHAGADVHVDCAVVELECHGALPFGWRIVEDRSCAIACAAPGMRVTKLGAATGWTRGVIVDARYAGTATIDGRAAAAPRQLLVRSTERGRPFSADGDSGAVVRDERGAIVGLLWGVSPGGDGVACPTGPAMWVLHARPVRLVPDGDDVEAPPS